jgi:hypothetical protein
MKRPMLCPATFESEGDLSIAHLLSYQTSEMFASVQSN